MINFTILNNTCQAFFEKMKGEIHSMNIHYNNIIRGQVFEN